MHGKRGCRSNGMKRVVVCLGGRLRCVCAKQARKQAVSNSAVCFREYVFIPQRSHRVLLCLFATPGSIVVAMRLDKRAPVRAQLLSVVDRPFGWETSLPKRTSFSVCTYPRPQSFHPHLVKRGGASVTYTYTDTPGNSHRGGDQPLRNALVAFYGFV